MDAGPDAGHPPRLLAGSDAVAVGREARALLDAGARVAVFVGDADADVIAEFLAGVVRSTGAGG